MSADWIKWSSFSHTNLKMLRAGRDGRLLFLGILELHAIHGNGGVLPARHSEPAALALALPAYEFTEETARKAVDACRDSGLVRINSTTGEIAIVGWDEDWMPKCVRCNRPNTESRFATCPACRTRVSVSKSRRGSNGDVIDRE